MARKAIRGIIATLACAALGPGTAIGASGGLAPSRSMADTKILQQTSDWVLALVNFERMAHGLAPLRPSPPLNESAQRHSRDMVERQYFSHVSPEGRKVRDRALRSGYGRGRGRSRVGETIAWGITRGTPAELVRSFIKSAGHRRIVLDNRYREIGIGLALGAPVGGVSDGVTLTLNLGRR